MHLDGGVLHAHQEKTMTSNRLVSRDVTALHRERAKFRWMAGSGVCP